MESSGATSNNLYYSLSEYAEHIKREHKPMPYLGRSRSDAVADETTVRDNNPRQQPEITAQDNNPRQQN